MTMSSVPTNLDLTLMALADPTRRAILQRLAAGEARVTELAAPFPMSLNAVSKHIRVLERAALVRRRRSGREHLLSFNPAPLTEAAAWIAAQQAAWNARLDILDELLREQERSGICTDQEGAGPSDAGEAISQGDENPMPEAEHKVTVVREFDANPDDIYAAWTEPEQMRRWMAQQVEADVRVGGRYRNELTGDDGQTYIHNGEYLDLEPGRRIVQTFHVGDEAPSPDYKEFLEVTLRPLGPAKTELTFTDGWVGGNEMSEEDQAAVKAAWNGWLDKLAKLF